MPKAKTTTKTTKTATKSKPTKATTATKKATAKNTAVEAPETTTPIDTAPQDSALETANAAETPAEADNSAASVEADNAEALSAESAEASAVEESAAEGEAAPAKLSWDLVASRMSADFIGRCWDFMVRTAPTREVWALLGKPEHAPVKMRITKGFQRTANSLRLPVVRHRLQDELALNAELTAKILLIWATTTPKPTSLTAVEDFEADDNLFDQIPDLCHRFGHEATMLSLLALRRYQVITLWSEKVASSEWSLETPATEDAVGEEAPNEQPNNEKQLAAANEEIRKLQQNLEKSEQKLRQAQASLISAKDNFARETHELQARLKQEENRFVREHEKLEDDERLLDRTTRKLKSAEKQVEELEAENKRQKKQVRQQQEVNEELQKEIAALKTQIEELEDELENGLPEPEAEEPQPAVEARATALASYLRAPAGPLPAVMVPASRTISSSPLDQVFQWNADGRAIRVTTREIKRGIDANNEGWVFALIQALDALRHASPEGYRLLLERVKELDSYYFRVLTLRTTRVLVDASNVARYERNRMGKGQVRFLMVMRDELRRRNCFPIRFIADASLPYNVDVPDDLTAMVRRGELEMTAAGQEADEVLAREARRTGAFVVTNDRSFHTKTSPHFEPPRLAFHFYEQHLVMDDF